MKYRIFNDFKHFNSDPCESNFCYSINFANPTSYLSNSFSLDSSRYSVQRNNNPFHGALTYKHRLVSLLRRVN